jgi:ribosomal protein L37E
LEKDNMATSTCAKCGHTSFEIAESAISGLRFKRDFLQCGRCGGVIGVIEADNLNGRLDAIEERLKELSSGGRRPRIG